MADYAIVSSDNHVMEPPDLWTERADAKYKDRVPRIIRREKDNTDWWYCDDLPVIGVGAGAQAGVRFEEPEKLSLSDLQENVRLGGYIPEEHIKDMDIDGVKYSIVYPTVGLILFSQPDGKLLNHVFKCYNDWVAEFCQPIRDRVRGIAMINIDDVQEGVKELERTAKLGFCGAMITVYPPEERSYNMPEYEPLWAAAQDLQMPLSLHIGTNRPGSGQEFMSLEEVTSSFMANVDHWVRTSIGHMIFTGVFERYPKLQVGSVEMELSWVPHFLDRIDYVYTQRVTEFVQHRFKSDTLPSDFFHQNIFLGFQEDALGIRDRDIIGVDSLLWGSDYPHFESTFPRSRQIIDEILVDCTEEEKAKIAGGNSMRIYNLS